MKREKKKRKRGIMLFLTKIKDALSWRFGGKRKKAALAKNFVAFLRVKYSVLGGLDENDLWDEYVEWLRLSGRDREALSFAIALEGFGCPLTNREILSAKCAIYAERMKMMEG